FFFFSSRRRHTRFSRDWSSDVCSSDLSREDALILEEEKLGAVGGYHDRFDKSKIREIFARHSIDIDDSETLGALRQIQKYHDERSEERRVGKECRTRWWPYSEKQKENN